MASGDTLAVFTPLHNEPPASAFATLDLRANRPVLDFDGSTDEESVYAGVMPRAYAGGGVTVVLHVAFTSATSGTSRWQVAFERVAPNDLDIDTTADFASFQSAAGAANGTSGKTVAVSIAFSDGAQMDSLVAGDPFRLKVRRDADGTSGTDDITTDAELMMIEVRET